MGNYRFIKALQDFKDARRQAAIEEIFAQITGREEEIKLLPYQEIRDKLRGLEKSSKYLKDIPLDAIVGSVGRYHEFTRSFLPRKTVSEDRWARIMTETAGLSGLPPIEVYKISEVYFVKDGNHRVSVARQLGNETIQAYVTEVEVNVPITRDSSPDQIIIKAEYSHFLEQTKIDQLRPEADLKVTKPGAYPTLLEHIEIHRYYMGLEENRSIPYPEAVTHWYDHVFLPLVKIFEEKGILREFPRRTQTDLYLWLAEHRAELEQKLGWDVGPEAAALDLAEQHATNLHTELKKIGSRLLEIITPEVLKGGPPAGSWREKRQEITPENQLFKDILVALDHSPKKGHVLQQSLVIAAQENSRLHAIHIHPPQAETQADHLEDIRREFEQACQNHAVQDYDLTLSTGDIPQVICQQARFTDLLVLPLNYPPGEKPLQRLSSGMRTIIKRCPRPIMTVPGPATPLQHALLAFDGSPKSQEALYIAAYAASRWGCSLTVLTSTHGLSQPEAVQNQARSYLLDQGVRAAYVLKDESVAQAMADQVERQDINLILIGGYGGSSLAEVVLGSSVDEVLRRIALPTLICR